MNVDNTKRTRNSKPRVDLTGQKFNNLTPLYYIKGGKWHCKCDCGNEIDVDTRNLKSGHTKSCGCLRKQVNSKNNTVDMTNYEDDNLKVLERNGSDSGGIALWECMCKHCGNIFITRGSNIRNKDTQSCGCVHSLNEQRIVKMLKESNVEFSTQYTFPNLLGVNNGHLRFDFAIFNNGKLSHLIEYNGLQHYIRPEGKWKEGYDSLIENDKRKKEYCKKNNIHLIVIKYNQDYSLNDLLI